MFRYNSLTVTVILISSAGGTATALMLKYLDNIYKNFASSMSIVFASMCSFFIFNQYYGFKFFVGSLLVCLSLFIYQSAVSSKSGGDKGKSDSVLPMYNPKNIVFSGKASSAA